MPELVLTKNLKELRGRWLELREHAQQITGTPVELWETDDKTFVEFDDEARRDDLRIALFLNFL